MFANNWEEMPQYFVSSATEQTGKDSILGYIAEVNEDIFKNGGAF